MPNFRFGLFRLVLAAAALHIIFVIGVFLIGQAGIAPNSFDTHGIGVSFAIDSKSYRIEAEELANALHSGKISQWLSHPRLHVKLYSLCFFATDWILGANILSAEPLNLTSFLLIVVLIYSLGKEIFDQRVGLLAAGTVALWPSFLLHSTQMLRDPLFIAAFLLMILIFVILLTRTLSWRQGALAGVLGSITCLFLWLIRGDWWELIFAVLVVGIIMPLLKQVGERKFRVGNTLSALIILVAGMIIPMVVPTYRQSDQNLRRTVATQPVLKPTSQTGSRFYEGSDSWGGVPKRIGLLRHKFIVRYPESGSNMDTDIELNGPMDLVRYLPRAIAIGLFSPFPNMWFSRGAQVGLVGRLVAGAEMFGFYLIEGLALLCIILNRRRLPVWLILATVLVGVTALGYVVVNVSTIYRMRYTFSMLVIVLGAKGVMEIRSLMAARAAMRSSGQVDCVQMHSLN